MIIKLALFLSLILFSASVHAQNSFLKTYVAEDPVCATSVDSTVDNQIVVVGGNNSANGSFFLRLQKDGTIISSRRLSGSSEFSATKVRALVNGSAFVVAGSTVNAAGDTDGVLIKIKPAGGIAWKRKFGTVTNDVFVTFTQVFDGGFVVLGETDTANASRDLILVKFSPAGRVLWNRSFGTSGYDRAFSIAHTGDGGLILAGESHDNSETSPSKSLVVKVDGSGNIQWSKSFQAIPGFNAGQFVIQTVDGYFVVHYSTNSAHAKGRSVVSKLTATGDLLWSRSYQSGTSSLNVANAELSLDFGLVLSGSVRAAASGKHKSVILKIDPAGSIEWKKSIRSGSRSNLLSAVVPTSDGNFIATGCFGVSEHEAKEVSLLKVDSDGDIDNACTSLVAQKVSVKNVSVTNQSISLTPSTFHPRTTRPAITSSGISLAETIVCE